MWLPKPNYFMPQNGPELIKNVCVNRDVKKTELLTDAELIERQKKYDIITPQVRWRGRSN